jgi:conflict system STAND superfamily ATPase
MGGSALTEFIEAYVASRETGAAQRTPAPRNLTGLRKEDLYLIRPPTRPYPGLRSFEPREEQIFFGRDRQADAVRDRLASCNVVVVLGGSGSGKSSLIRAGVLPKLNSTGRIPERDGRWYATEYRPGEIPSVSLFEALWSGICVRTFGALPGGWEALASGLGLSAEPGQVEDACRKCLLDMILPEKGNGGRILSASGLANFVNKVLREADEYLSKSRRSLVAGPANLFILADQFEEYFRPGVSEGERSEIVALLRLAQDTENGRLFFAVTLRSEELHRCSEIEGLADIVNRGPYLLDFMNEEELRASIVAPARRSLNGWRVPVGDGDTSPFDPVFVDEILNWTKKFASERDRSQHESTNKADLLPLMQNLLRITWSSAVQYWQENPAADLRITRSDLDRRMSEWREKTAAFRTWLRSTEPEFKAKLAGEVESVSSMATLPLHAVNPLSECLDLAATVTLREAVSVPGETDSFDVARLHLVQAAFTMLATRDDRRNIARRPAKTAEIINVAQIPDDAKSRELLTDALSAFERRSYLLRRKEPKGDFRYDVSHEAFIRNSSDCVRWIGESEDVKKALLRVQATVQEGEKAAAPKTWTERIVDKWLLKQSERASTMVSPETGLKLERVFGDQAIFDTQWAENEASLSGDQLRKIRTVWQSAKSWRYGGGREKAQRRVFLAIAGAAAIVGVVLVSSIAYWKATETAKTLTETSKALDLTIMAANTTAAVQEFANYSARKELAATIAGLNRNEAADIMNLPSPIFQLVAKGTVDNAARSHFRQVDVVAEPALPAGKRKEDGWEKLDCIVTNADGEPVDPAKTFRGKPADDRGFAWVSSPASKNPHQQDKAWMPVTGTDNSVTSAVLQAPNMVQGITIACPTSRLDYVLVWNRPDFPGYIPFPPLVWPVLWSHISNNGKASWQAALDQQLTIRSTYNDETRAALRKAADRIVGIQPGSGQGAGSRLEIYSRRRNTGLEFLIPVDDKQSLRLFTVVGYSYPLLVDSRPAGLGSSLKDCKGTPTKAENVSYECKVDLAAESLSLTVRSKLAVVDGKIDDCRNATKVCVNDVQIFSRTEVNPSQEAAGGNAKGAGAVQGPIDILRARVDFFISPLILRAGIWQGDLYLEDAGQQVWKIALGFVDMKQALESMPTPEVTLDQTSEFCRVTNCLSLNK